MYKAVGAILLHLSLKRYVVTDSINSFVKNQKKNNYEFLAAQMAVNLIN